MAEDVVDKGAEQEEVASAGQRGHAQAEGGHQ